MAVARGVSTKSFTVLPFPSVRILRRHFGKLLNESHDVPDIVVAVDPAV
jgi:hypothetical protein